MLLIVMKGWMDGWKMRLDIIITRVIPSINQSRNSNRMGHTTAGCMLRQTNNIANK
jgi:hypothetical protein